MHQPSNLSVRWNLVLIETSLCTSKLSYEVNIFNSLEATVLNRFLTRSILIFFGETVQMSQNLVFISKISFEVPTKMNLQGGKSLQRTFSLSPVSHVFSQKLHFIIWKMTKISKFHLERTAVGQNANYNISVYPKYDW